MSGDEGLSLDEARWKLARFWFFGALIIIVLLVAQSTIGDVYEGHLKEVWGWALPTLMPLLSLVITVLAADALISDDDAESPRVQRKFYVLAFWLSVFYLLLVLFSIVVQPFTDEDVPIAESLNQTNLWLTPVQSLVIAAMGALFFSKQAKQA